MQHDIVKSVGGGRQNGKSLYSATVENRFVFPTTHAKNPRGTISRRTAKKISGTLGKKVSTTLAVQINPLNPCLCGCFSQTLF